MIEYKFRDINSIPSEIIEVIESKGYKRAVKIFETKRPDVKEVAVEWISRKGNSSSKIIKLPIRKRKNK